MKRQVIAAVAFLTNHEDKLFIAKRSDTKKFMPGIWELPGEHIEFGESIADGLQRELKEEFNIEVGIGRPFDSFTYLSADGEEHVLEIACFAPMPSQAIPKLNPNDHSKCGWITKNEISRYLAGNRAEMEIAKNGFKIIGGETQP